MECRAGLAIQSRGPGMMDTTVPKSLGFGFLHLLELIELAGVEEDGVGIEEGGASRAALRCVEGSVGD